jgi:hypothetical protein
MSSNQDFSSTTTSSHPSPRALADESKLEESRKDFRLSLMGIGAYGAGRDQTGLQQQSEMQWPGAPKQHAPSINHGIQQQQHPQSPYAPDANIQYPMYAQSPYFANIPQNSLYTFPRQYGSFQHPITPEDVARIQSGQAAQLYAQNVHPPNGDANIQMYNQQASQPEDEMHNCGCGDSCDCLGCVAHPYNNRTVTYVQSLRDVMSQDVPQDRRERLNSGVRHISTSMAPATSDTGGSCCGGNGPAASGAMPPPPIPTQKQGSCCAPVPDSPPLHSQHQLPRSSTSEHPSGGSCCAPGPTKSVSPMSPTGSNTSENSQNTVRGEHDSNGGDQDGDSISPSAFYHVEYPSACGMTNGCLCGEGCTCVGCITHSGHDGIALENFAGDMGASLGEVGAVVVSTSVGHAGQPILRSTGLGGGGLMQENGHEVDQGFNHYMGGGF